ncbi:MAG: arylsulfatase, partial [Opitutaceae bacterium]
PYGAEIQTPHLDRLAAGGLRFSQFYNNPRCCPTRVSLMTGLYPPQTGIPHMVNTSHLPQHQRDLSRNVVTIAEVLRSAGYQTAMSGKWHLTPVPDGPPDKNGKLFALPVTAETDKGNWPLQRGFDRFYGIIHAIGSFYDPVTLTEGNESISPHGRDYYFTHAVSDNAVKFVKEMGGSERPFFLYVAYTAPHWPLHAPAEYVAKYKAIYRRGWDRIRAQRFRRLQESGLVGAGWKLSAKDFKAGAWETVEHADWEAHRMAVHAAMIERMDDGIGRIVAELERQHRLDDTLILFLSDNGASAEGLGPRPQPHSWAPATAPGGARMRFGNDPRIYPGPADTWTSYGQAWANVSVTPFRTSKHWTHEGAIATPLIAHWPRTIGRGRISHYIGQVMDIMATCVDLAGATYPKDFAGNKITAMEGISLAPVFENKTLADRTLFWEHDGNRAVRQGKWKIVSRYTQPWELYDMEADRTETNDLATQEAGKVERLASLYDAWAHRVGVLPWETIEPSEADRQRRALRSAEARKLETEAREQAATPAFDSLSDLPWSRTGNLLSGPHKDRSGWDPHATPPRGGYKPIEIAGARFDKGLSWFPDKIAMSFVEWDLK